jgi:hypothetical protein
MPARYWVLGGVDTNFGTVGNWSDTSGGAGGFSVPGTADDAIFDANSPLACNTNGSRSVLSLNCTGWTGGVLTFATSNTITIGAGGLTLIAGMTLTMSGTNRFICATNGATYRSNGLAVHRMDFTGSGVTHTLLDDFTISDQLSVGASGITTINGFRFLCQKDCLHNGNNASVQGTTEIVMAGTGTIQTTGTGTARFVLPVTMNSSGTITWGTILRIGGPLTYTAGTIVTTGNTLEVESSNATLDIAAINLNNLIINGTLTHTLLDDLNVYGLAAIGESTGSTTINGFAINCYGGTRYNGSTGRITGSTVVNVIGAQAIDCPSATTGGMFLPIVLNAPGGTITIAAGFWGDLGDISIVDGTTVSTATDSFTPGAGGSGAGFYSNAM